MSAEPISEERLAALRTLKLDVLFPASSAWSQPTRERAERWIVQLRPVFEELFGEIDSLDADLDDLDTELTAACAELRSLKEPVSLPQPEIGAVRVRRASQKRWRTYWREGAVRRSETFLSRQAAESWAMELRAQAHRGGAR